MARDGAPFALRIAPRERRPAVANAVCSACGVGVCDYPITLDKLLKGLPPMA
jgi:hypothetical protein